MLGHLPVIAASAICFVGRDLLALTGRSFLQVSEEAQRSVVMSQICGQSNVSHFHMVLWAWRAANKGKKEKSSQSTAMGAEMTTWWDLSNEHWKYPWSAFWRKSFQALPPSLLFSFCFFSLSSYPFHFQFQLLDLQIFLKWLGKRETKMKLT